VCVCVLSIFKVGSYELFAPEMALNLDPPKLCLLSSCDCRSELPVPSLELILTSVFGAFVQGFSNVSTVLQRSVSTTSRSILLEE
jgi:hypothetical protein